MWRRGLGGAGTRTGDAFQDSGKGLCVYQSGTMGGEGADTEGETLRAGILE